MNYLVNVNLSKNELQNARIQNLATAPSSPVVGQIYFDTTVGTLMSWDGTTWRVLDSLKLTDGTLPIAKLSTNPLARANHTGTQTANTISDLATTVQAYRLDQFAAPTASLSINNQKLINVLAGTADTDGVNLKQVKDLIMGITSRKDAARVVATTNITLSGLQTIDGVTLVASDRVLVIGQTTASQNGLYSAATGAWTRTADADSSDEVKPGMMVFVSEGGTNGDKTYQLTTDGPITLGTTALNFVLTGQGGTSYSAGNGLTLTGSTFDIGSGTGITVTADAIAVDTTVVTRKVTANIGDGSATSFVVTHNLNNQFPHVQVVTNASPWDVVYPDIEMTSANTCTIRINTAPAANAYKVIVIG